MKLVSLIGDYATDHHFFLALRMADRFSWTMESCLQSFRFIYLLCYSFRMMDIQLAPPIIVGSFLISSIAISSMRCFIDFYTSPLKLLAKSSNFELLASLFSPFGFSVRLQADWHLYLRRYIRPIKIFNPTVKMIDMIITNEMQNLGLESSAKLKRSTEATTFQSRYLPTWISLIIFHFYLIADCWLL